MAKRSNVSGFSELEELEATEDLPIKDYDFEGEELIVEQEPELEVVALQLMKPIKLNIFGPVTGVLYVFDNSKPGTASILNVDKRDAEVMLLKRSGAKCCPGSSTQQQPYFNIVAR